MSGLQCLASENVWLDKHRYDEAEKHFYEGANGPAPQQQQVEETIGNCHRLLNKPTLVKQIFIVDSLHFRVLSRLSLVSEGPVDSRMTLRVTGPWLHHCLKAAVFTRVKPPSLEVAHHSEGQAR